MESIIGMKFNRLTIMEILEKKVPNTSRRCVAKCECGKVKEFILKHVRYGNTISCGCAYGESRKTHGMSKTRLAKVFKNMVNRCYNPKCEEYHNYGQRGIKIYDEWMNDRSTFFKWAIENGYTENLQIDRKEVNGNYDPDNCRFVTPLINANNKRNNLLVTINGETKACGLWAMEFGLTSKTVYGRIKDGWDPVKALTTPIQKQYARPKSKIT